MVKIFYYIIKEFSFDNQKKKIFKGNRMTITKIY